MRLDLEHLLEQWRSADSEAWKSSSLLLLSHFVYVQGWCGFPVIEIVFLVRVPGIKPDAGREREEQVINSKHKP